MKTYHFTLTEPQVDALCLLVDGVANTGALRRNSQLIAAADALADQAGMQLREYERCPTCTGSGWVEDS